MPDDDFPPPPPPPPPPVQSLRTAIANLRGIKDSYSKHEKSQAADDLEAFLREISKTK